MPTSVIDDLKKEVETFTPVELQGGILLSLDSFIKIQGVITKFSSTINKEVSKKFTEDRRKLLAEKKEAEYQSMVQAQLASNRNNIVGISQKVLEFASVNP